MLSSARAPPDRSQGFTTLFNGVLGVGITAAVSHWPWFTVNNVLQRRLPPPHSRPPAAAVAQRGDRLRCHAVQRRGGKPDEGVEGDGVDERDADELHGGSQGGDGQRGAGPAPLYLSYVFQ
jgi:hypothetical protein